MLGQGFEQRLLIAARRFHHDAGDGNVREFCDERFNALRRVGDAKAAEFRSENVERFLGNVNAYPLG